MPTAWPFLAIEPPMERQSGDLETSHAALCELLEVGANQAFKVWRLSPALKILSVVVGVFGLAVTAGLTYHFWNQSLISVRGVALVLIVAAAAHAGAGWAVRIVRWRDSLTSAAIGTGLSVFGAALARIHLWVFDWWFLRLGRVKPLLALRAVAKKK